jgi:hypothetical protein
MTLERTAWAVSVILFLGIVATAIIWIWTGDTRLGWVCLVMLAPLAIVTIAAAAATGTRQQRIRGTR